MRHDRRLRIKGSRCPKSGPAKAAREGLAAAHIGGLYCRDGSGCRVGSGGREAGGGREGAGCREGSNSRPLLISRRRL
jgi:hypothetical protein